MKTNLLFVNRKRKVFKIVEHLLTITLATHNAGNVLKLCEQGTGGYIEHMGQSEKTYLWALQPGKTQTSLVSYRD